VGGDTWRVSSIRLLDHGKGKVENNGVGEGQEGRNEGRAVGRGQWQEDGGQKAINNADQTFNNDGLID